MYINRTFNFFLYARQICTFAYLVSRLSSILFLPGDDDEEESGEERLPSCFDYIMHFLTVFWKVLFAFVPPTEYWNGWACFFVSISLIGVLTAVTGDLASHFGCTIGLKDSVTAVVFVALGTSVPGRCLRCQPALTADLSWVSGAFDLQQEQLLGHTCATFASTCAVRVIVCRGIALISSVN